MIFEQVENIFQLYPECIVHPVSCTGVSHDILSKQIKKSYPDYFREYTRFCIRKKLTLGEAHFYEVDALFGTKYIVTLTVKDNWQEKIRAEVFKNVLNKLIEKAVELKISTIALPKMEEVPLPWLEDQLQKLGSGKADTIERIIFFIP